MKSGSGRPTVRTAISCAVVRVNEALVKLEQRDD